MTDRATLCMAVCAVTGAWLACGPAPLLGVTVLVLALAVQRPWLLCIGVALLAGGLAVRAQQGLHPPDLGPYAGTVTLLSDPESFGDSLRVDVRARGKRLEAWIDDGTAAAAVFGDRLAGERVAVDGSIQRSPPGADWLTARHIVGRMTITAAHGWAPGPPVVRLANGVRRTLENGAAVLPDDERALYLGFVLGDDRGQSPETADDFRGAGLTHLLAVSGQNLAFVIALTGPVLRRLEFRGRLPATLAVIGFFALVTRFEPSVLRASVMAGVAALAAAMGREASGLRCLALAITGLVLIDPLLVRSVGFQLSAAASAGILLLSHPLARRLPGPRPLVEALSVTVAAQLAVAPILVITFGGLPLASVPANLLAAPVAGPVMAWGLAAGLVAGLVPAPVAAVLHLPTELMIRWLALVAKWAAHLPLGELGLRELLVFVPCAAAAIAAARLEQRALAGAAAVLATAALAAPAIAMHGATPLLSNPAPGAELWRARGTTVLVLDGRVRASDLLEGVRREGVTDLDVVIVELVDNWTADAAAAIHRAHPEARLYAPVAARLSGATAVEHPSTLELGGLTVALEPGPGNVTAVVVANARSPPCRFQPWSWPSGIPATTSRRARS